MNNLTALKVTYNNRIQQTQYINTWTKTILELPSTRRLDGKYISVTSDILQTTNNNN